MRTFTAVLAITSAAACASPGPITAQQPAPDDLRTIQVSARATVERVPDRAVVTLAVENIAETAAQATARNAAAMERVLAAVRELGIPAARIRTTRVALHPRYDQRRDQPEPRIVGYQATNQVMVRVDDVALVGQVIDAAVRAGANRVTGVGFELSDPQSAYHEALRLAIDRARAAAQVAADALGERLGPALQVSTDGAPIPMPRMEAAMRADVATAPPPPVEPGELAVAASVRIVYRLGT